MYQLDKAVLRLEEQAESNNQYASSSSDTTITFGKDDIESNQTKLLTPRSALNLDSVSDSPRSKRGTWRLPSSSIIFAPTSPSSPTHKSMNSAEENSLLQIVDQFSSQITNPGDGGGQSKEVTPENLEYTSKRVLCPEERMVPKRLALSDYDSESPRTSSKRTKRESQITTTNRESKHSRTKSEISNYLKQKSGKKKSQHGWKSNMSLESSTLSPRIMRHLQQQISEEDTVSDLVKFPMINTCHDPFKIQHSSPDVTRSREWLEHIFEKRKIQSQIASDIKEASRYTSERLGQLERRIKSNSLDNKKRMLEIQLANVHLKHIEKLIREFGELVRSCEMRGNWCTTIQQFISFYSEVTQNREKLSKGIQLSDPVQDSDLMSVDFVMPSPRASPDDNTGILKRGTQATSICVTKDGTTVKRTVASMVTTKATPPLSPRMRRMSLPSNSKMNTSLVTELAQLQQPSPEMPTSTTTSPDRTTRLSIATISTSESPLDEPSQSYSILIDECMSWFVSCLRKHIRYFFDTHTDYSGASIEDRVEIKVIRASLCPWLGKIVKASSLNQKTIVLVSQLLDTIRQQFEIHQIALM